MAHVSPFTKAAIASMRHLYPETLADKSFDNTGLLLESPIASQLPRKSNSVLLTIDLTKAVANEAIEENVSLVVAYHPIIFRGLKSLTLEDSQQQTLLRLAGHGISVYSPHTAVDIVPGGMADWLCDIATGKIEPGPEPETFTATSEQPLPHPDSASEVDITTSEEDEPKTPDNNSNESHPNGSADKYVEKQTTPQPKKSRPNTFHRTYSKPSYPSYTRDQQSDREPESDQVMPAVQISSTTAFQPHIIAHTKEVISPSPASAINTANASHSSPIYDNSNTGAGRYITFDTEQPLSTLITRIAHATGTPKGFPVAIPQDKIIEDIKIRTIGICPGSGSSVIRGCRDPPDSVFTGELSHHEALAVIERGASVISLFHSNSERGYLDGVMRQKLQTELETRWEKFRAEAKNSTDALSTIEKEIVSDNSVNVIVSRRDRDPFGIVVLQESRVTGEMVG